ncbi:MAG TPA: tetratricopeptide repeat protein, partial [Burkholderiales bacterium]|nr:tetratricopeptide repeat protein [Burkholderiales bacterium]
MELHAFVAMPFGTKEGINFDVVYSDLIKPALEAAGLEAFRADGEIKAGDIRKDMFQELLLADLVVVDASIDNPNVWYELGVRHALRERDVVVIACREGRLPFDISTDRVLRYNRKGGAPDPLKLEADKNLLTQYIL